MGKQKYTTPQINTVNADWDIVLMANSPNHSGDGENFLARRRKIEKALREASFHEDESANPFGSKPFSQNVEW